MYYYRVQTISDIISTQIKWNKSNNFPNVPIELLFEVSEVCKLAKYIIHMYTIIIIIYMYNYRFKTTQTITFHVCFGILMLTHRCKFYNNVMCICMYINQ